MSFKEWSSDHIVKSFQRSWAWLSAVGALVISYGPDLVSMLLLRWDWVQTALPTLGDEWKARVMLAGAILVVITRPIRQRSMPPVTIPVATVNVPSTVEMGHSGVQVATEVEHIDRSKTDPGPH